MIFVAAALFAIGVAVVLTKRNVIAILIGLELMLNAANLNLVAFSRYDADLLQGQTFALFVIALAAAESAIGLAIALKVYQHFKTLAIDDISELKN